jgi:hypothetical protein
MPGAVRRNKPLKAKTDIADVNDFSIVNPADGDLLVFDSTDGAWENGKALTGDYTVTGSWTAGSFVTAGALSAGSAAITTDLNVGGDVVITDDLVADEATFRTITTSGAAVLGTTASIAGALTGAGFSFSGSGTIAGTLGVTGASALADITGADLDLTGDMTAVNLGLSGVLTATSNISSGGNVSATGALSAATLSATGNVTIGGTFLVSGNYQSTTDGGTYLTVGGLVIPVGTTVQEPTGQAGMIRYDSTTNAVRWHNGTVWADLSSGGGGLSDVVDDLTPQLGGSLDVNGQKIVSVTNGNIDIEPNGTGNVLLGNFTFDADQTVGVGQDNYVLTYDNGTGLISLEAAAGGLPAEVSITWTAGVTTIAGEDDLSVSQSLLVGDADGTVALYYDGTQVVETDTRGLAAISSASQPSFYMRDSAGGAERASFQAWSDNHFYMTNHTAGGDLIIRVRNVADTANETAIYAHSDGAVDLYYNAVKEFETKSGGVIVDDELQVNGALNHDGTTVGFYGTTPAAQSAAYTRTATVVESRTLAASASATTTNNNNVLAALIADLQAIGILG